MNDFSTPHGFVDVGHSQVATYRFGTGPDLLFVHGWPLSAATFRHVVRELRGTFTCHLVDLPGAGNTRITSRTPIDLHAHTDTVRAVVDALGLSRFALLAHDSGAFVARRLAAAEPRVCGLALANTEIPGHTPPLLVAYALLARSGVGEHLLRPLLASPHVRRSALGFGGCFTDPRTVEGEFHELFVRPLLESTDAMRGAMALLRSVDASTLRDLARLHGEIAAPTQFIWGADDPWFPLAKAKRMPAQMGGPAHLVEIPGGKLFVHEDHPREVARHARAFLLECFAEPATIAAA